MPSVFISCCNGTGWIRKEVLFAVLEMEKDPRYRTKFIAPTKSPFVANLHYAVREFLQSGFDFLLLVDDDNPPQNNPLELSDLDLDVVGLPTPVWHSEVKGDRPFYFNALTAVYKEDGTVEGFKPLQDSAPGFQFQGLHEVDAVGTGCILIARRVLETLMRKAIGKPMATPFMRTWDDTGAVVMGNDYAFCTRAKAAGFKIHAHFDYMCHHHNELELTSTIESFWAAGRNG